METSLYVALSSQVALDKRLTTIANNVANSNTTGFRAGEVRFDEVLSGIAGGSTSFVSEGKSYLSSAKGSMERTGSSLDFAIQGDAWFAAQTPGGVIVTRDGRFRLNDVGELTTIDGHNVLDPGGAPVQLNPAGGTPTVQRDGFIVQDGVQVGAIGLYEYKPGADYKRFGNSGILAETPPIPAVDQAEVSVLQGYLEESNVNPVGEMSKLITLHRTFDNIAALIRDGESSFDQAIRTLGSPS